MGDSAKHAHPYISILISIGRNTSFEVRYNRYTVFFNYNFGWVLLPFIYMTIILTAMQVGLGTDKLQRNKRFQ
jgi:hypothetical protein